ncbi:Shedu anti-phage system protein SduA domain-containing protein [Leuconostoc lactis]|uniref:Shedu anti-phage system protein SduA domain-containing protein n=1 Tax=Leuconostoc lactis TaxID=1246 RepID=UPI0024ACF82C|nr:Shedu anti-phage system protein SduA domain-containing protein [Leuconostoc lactis]MDI6495688.1 DUF4263 domain-containing protein [Leuconostoc lactis]
MPKEIIYENGFMFLKQDFEDFYRLKLIYLLPLINPRKLVNVLNTGSEDTVDYFKKQSHILRLFSQEKIYDNWVEMSIEQKNTFYQSVLERNQDLCEIIDASLEINSVESLVEILENCRDKCLTRYSGDATFLIPIGRSSRDYENYYVLNSLKFDEPSNKLYIYTNLRLKFNMLFLYNYGSYGGYTNIWNSVFSVLNNNEIFIGGDAEGNITLETVVFLKKHLVKKSEAETYINHQNSILLQQYFENTNMLELQEELSGQQKRRSLKNETMGPIVLENDDRKAIETVNTILSVHLKELKKMLGDDSKSGRNFVQSEKKYQTILLKIFPYIFPQYTHFLREYSFKIDGNSKKNRDIPDFLALNSDLSVDVIEIKTPYKKIFTKTRYRKNYIFDREVLGLITQTQKYIYNLERNALREEKNILNRFREKTDFNGTEINVASPKGIVIVGRGPQNDPTLSSSERREINLSLSIMKNRYQDILDFLTFDDVVDRIERVISRSTDHIDIL